MFMAVVVALAVAAPLSVRGINSLLGRGDLYGGVFAGATLLLAVGLADDFLDLSPAVKLLAQVFAAMLAASGGVSLRYLSFGADHVVTLGWIGVPLAVLWIVAVTNAFNFIDGLDGLASSIGIVGFGAVAVSAALLGRRDVLLLSVAMIGALVGFLRYNFAPARIYLGDGGSLFVGYLLAALSIEGATSPKTGALVYVPLFALALPLLDAAVAIVRRWLRRMPVWKGDHRHIHHRVLALGLSKRGSVGVLAAVAGLFAMTGLAAAFAGPDALAARLILAAAVSIAVIAAGIRRLDYYEFAAVRTAVRLRASEWRRFVREEIRLRDAERELATSHDLNELRTGLDRCALAFGLDRIEISRQRPRLRRAWHGEHLDVPVSDVGTPSSDDWFLRVWHGEYDSPRPELVHRVAQALSRSCGHWLRDYGLLGAAPWTVAAREGPRRSSWTSSARHLAKA
ncbi:MAG: undecaprenyl/decaprenyl-phosphate alpha-N-acetylglucosaminyl 1-phosphate transferase [Gemmatimonadota bacterium]|nr:undecaprenyl/decaprenyl-phosphate alpha-N-acetylglucosaminyl 1-phosphate transferase [Gemmatimonadota bacterium]MDE3215813.1 undecaprenyl/decaprenyl-phosphate alpha-N-acetylglucosaminyl 1-phosphate transferase [Gemmatimonadota bacterium]